MRLYQVCKAFKWNHLPLAGGIYDQHPLFLDDVLTIYNIEGRIEAERRKAEERKNANNRPKSAPKRGRRR